MSIRGLQPFLLAFIIACSGRSTDNAAGTSASKTVPPSLRDQLATFGGSFLTEQPPASLDRFYPPATQRMGYRDLMRELYLPLSFARTQAKRGNWESAKRSWARFIERFGRARTAVPEWESRFGSADEWQAVVGSIVGSGHTAADADRLEGAVSTVYGKYCEACHQIERMKAYARYHYGNFRAVWLMPPKVDDPLIAYILAEWKGKSTIPDGAVSFRDYMKLMNTQAMDVLNLTDAGDLDGARAAIDRLETYLGYPGFASACAWCHGGEPRRYFIDPESLERFHAVARALASPEVDRAAVLQQFNDAYDNTCSRCHNVHLIPAKLQRSWALSAQQVAPLQ